MRVLVTGSSGFLGGQVAHHLAADRSNQVIGFDLRSSPDDSFPCVQGDLCEPDALRNAARGMDVLVHFAGVGDVYLAAESPALAAQANVVGTSNVATAAAEAGAKVVYASTWEVYGPPIADPVDEQHPCNPGHIYAATKLAGELVLRALHRHYGAPVVILRLGTAYGPGMRPNTVFNRFVQAAKAGGAVVVQGTGAQWRQFTHTSDIASAVQLAAASELNDKTLNIVSEESVTILQLAELVAFRYQAPVTFAPERPCDPAPSRISSAEALRNLGWRAAVDFRQGLAELLDGADSGEQGQPLAAT
jgi:UDP-glucose 4-epimerase